MPDHATTTPPRERAPLPDRVTMPLLALVTRDAVDEDYLHAATRRAAAGEVGAHRRTRLRGAAVATVVFGLLIAMAAVQTARSAEVRQAGRDALVDRIDERRDEVTRLGQRVESLQEQNAELRASNSRVRGLLAESTVRLRTLQVSTGFVAVSGPGIRVTITDNPDGSSDGLVRATDLRRLVNGLWEAGADAIAVNGRRLTGVSAIAQSNIAIQVNRSPLTPPYVVSAIGGPDLATRLRASTSGQLFQSLADQFGFEVTRQNEDELLLPSAPDFLLRLRYVEQRGGRPDTLEDVP